MLSNVTLSDYEKKIGAFEFLKSLLKKISKKWSQPLGKLLLSEYGNVNALKS
jgi:hypothetical protein